MRKRDMQRDRDGANAITPSAPKRHVEIAIRALAQSRIPFIGGKLCFLCSDDCSCPESDKFWRTRGCAFARRLVDYVRSCAQWRAIPGVEDCSVPHPRDAKTARLPKARKSAFG